jgi:hypothetical protein
MVDAIVAHAETIRAYMLADPGAAQDRDRPRTRSLRALAQELGFRDDERPTYNGRYAVERCAAWLRGDGLVMLPSLFTAQEWAEITSRK